jgi:hypothetical protein
MFKIQSMIILCCQHLVTPIFQYLPTLKAFFTNPILIPWKFNILLFWTLGLYIFWCFYWHIDPFIPRQRLGKHVPTNAQPTIEGHPPLSKGEVNTPGILGNGVFDAVRAIATWCNNRRIWILHNSVLQMCEKISWRKMTTRIHRRKVLKIGHVLLYWAWTEAPCI